MSWTAQRHVAIDRQSLGPPGAEQAVAVSSTVVDRRPVAVERGDGRGDLAEMVEDLAGEFYTQPLLRRILTYSIKLLQADAGSISIVNQESGVYRKEVDIGIGCQSGRIFPLNEGVTGQVVARGGPVRFADYSQVPGGHLQVDDSGQVWGVIGVPIVWKNTIVGVFVLFSRDPERQFTEADGNALQVFAKYAALALANAQLYEESEARSRALPSGAALVRPPRPAVAEVVTHGLDFVIDQLWAVGEMVGEQADAQARLELARRAIEATSADVRRVVLGTFPLAAKGPWLTDALLTELRAARGMGRISSEVAVSGDACPLPVALSDHLLYVAREFLDCVIRRPGRHRVTALLTYAGPDVMLSLTDRTDDAPVGAGGHDGVIDMALRAMAERTRLMDGTFRADWPDPGTNRV